MHCTKVFLHGAPPELLQVAATLGLQPQTLGRQLRQEGNHFSTIKAQVRRDLAIYLLNETTLSIEEIAYRVSYTEPSAFIRAFKTWTGFTPLGFRKGLVV